MREKINRAFSELHFGAVDAESENDLSLKFLKTDDFVEFVSANTILVLGAKGSGKSAFFQLLKDFDFTARNLAKDELKNVIVVEATGFGDLTEINTDVISEFKADVNFNYPKLWRLYFSIKLAKKMSLMELKTKGAASEMMKSLKLEKDLRLLPFLQKIWGHVIGRVPNKISIPYFGEIPIGSQLTNVSPYEVLDDLNKKLVEKDKIAWLVFDRLDELYSMDQEERSLAISNLLLEAKSCQDKYNKIRFKILLRTDIWDGLSFVNKTHFSDKTLQLKWDNENLCAMLVKRALVKHDVKKYLIQEVGEVANKDVLEMTPIEVENIFYKIFDNKIYKGTREAKSLSWMVERSTDGSGGVYPRELIMFGNISKQKQEANKNGPGDETLIEGESIKSAYYVVSEARCKNYLSEFPSYKVYFDKFSGLTKTEFTRAELISLFLGLPNTEDAIRELASNIGILKPTNGNVRTAERFQVPRLYVYGLGIVIPGRP